MLNKLFVVAALLQICELTCKDFAHLREHKLVCRALLCYVLGKRASIIVLVYLRTLKERLR